MHNVQSCSFFWKSFTVTAVTFPIMPLIDKHGSILASPNFNQHQSAYRPGHSTETALVQLLDSIYHAADNGKATLLFSLDLSAAFDTIDHSILLHRLAHNFGLTGSALTWVQSYSLVDLKLFDKAVTPLTRPRVSLVFPKALSSIILRRYRSKLKLHRPMASNNNSTPMIHNSMLFCLRTAWLHIFLL